MNKPVSAPILSRVKSWQLVSFGLTGWCTLYSIALLTFGSGSFLIGNLQGGCFATTMTLAGVEARRIKRGNLAAVDPFQWSAGITTEQVNWSIASALREQSYRLEKQLPMDAELGIGVRAVSSGRTIVFETARWQEKVIDLPHAESTEENRKKALANVAFIVSQGAPNEEAKDFVRSKPLRFLCGEELKDIIASENPPADLPSDPPASLT